MHFVVVFLHGRRYHEHMKDKNTLTLDEIIAARNIRIAEANRKAAEIAKRNLQASPYRH